MGLNYGMQTPSLRLSGCSSHQGSNLGPRHGELGVLTTKAPGKSPRLLLKNTFPVLFIYSIHFTLTSPGNWCHQFLCLWRILGYRLGGNGFHRHLFHSLYSSSTCFLASKILLLFSPILPVLVGVYLKKQNHERKVGKAFHFDLVAFQERAKVDAGVQAGIFS